MFLRKRWVALVSLELAAAVTCNVSDARAHPHGTAPSAQRHHSAPKFAYPDVLADQKMSDAHAGSLSKLTPLGVNHLYRMDASGHQYVAVATEGSSHVLRLFSGFPTAGEDSAGYVMAPLPSATPTDGLFEAIAPSRSALYDSSCAADGSTSMLWATLGKRSYSVVTSQFGSLATTVTEKPDAEPFAFENQPSVTSAETMLSPLIAVSKDHPEDVELSSLVQQLQRAGKSVPCAVSVHPVELDSGVTLSMAEAALKHVPGAKWKWAGSGVRTAVYPDTPGKSLEVRLSQGAVDQIDVVRHGAEGELLPLFTKDQKDRAAEYGKPSVRFASRQRSSRTDIVQWEDAIGNTIRVELQCSDSACIYRETLTDKLHFMRG